VLPFLGPHIALVDTLDGDGLEVLVVDEVALLLELVQVPKPDWQPIPQYAEVEPLEKSVLDYKRSVRYAPPSA
jgi:hypothetical protein